MEQKHLGTGNGTEQESQLSAAAGKPLMGRLFAMMDTPQFLGASVVAFGLMALMNLTNSVGLTWHREIPLIGFVTSAVCCVVNMHWFISALIREIRKPV